MRVNAALTLLCAVSGETGYLADNSEDMEDFAAKTKALIEDKALQLQMGRDARKLAEGWSWETATSKLRNIQYRTAIRLHRSRDVVTGASNDEIERALLQHAFAYRPDLA